MWIWWKLRFQKCEFCDNWDFKNVNFVQNWDFQYVNFWEKCGILPQRVDKTFKIFVIAESFEWALATFHLANSRARRVCRPQTRLGVYFGRGRFWARGWWWIRCILHYCRRRLYFLSCIRKEKLPGNCKFFRISFLNAEFLISNFFFQDAYRFAKRIETALADIRKMHENQANSNLSVK